MFDLTRRHITTAVQDIREGVQNWRLWHLLAWQDIKQRYRRSTLGPLWLTISMAVQMFVMGVLMTFLLRANFGDLFPHICAGFVFWTLMGGIIGDGSMAFIGAQSYLLQIKRPLTIFIMQIIWRNIIILAHNFIVYVVIAAIFIVVPNWSVVLLPLSFLLATLSLAWMALFLGILSVRYRDIPMIVQSLLAMLFWATPIIYQTEQLGGKRLIADLNPLTHLLALIRDPLLGQTPALMHWVVALATAVVGWSVTFLFFARFRSRVVYWL